MDGSSLFAGGNQPSTQKQKEWLLKNHQQRHCAGASLVCFVFDISSNN